MPTIPISVSYFKDYDNKKQAVMTEEELQASSEYRQWYIASYRSKEDKNLYKSYATIDQYWEGNANIAEFEDDPASNTNIIHPFIEGQVSLMVDPNLEAQPHAQTPSEIEYIPYVKRMFDFVFENNKTIQILDMGIRRYLKFGIAINYAWYDPKWNYDFGLPKFKSINPAYFFPDPNITDIYDFQDGKFTIFTGVKSIAWAAREFGYDKADCIIPGYEPYSESTIYNENFYESSYIGNMHYLHMWIFEKYYDKKKLKLRLIQQSGDGTKLYNSVEEKHDFCSTDFPFFVAPCYAREGTIWPKGDAELILDQQDNINDLDDQLRMNARLTGNPQKVYDPNALIDGELWTNEHGLLLPVTGGLSGVGYLDPPSMPAYPMIHRNRIMDTDTPAITRFYPQMTGGRIKGVDTATESLSLQESGMRGVDHKKALYNEMLGDMSDYILKLCIHHWTDEKFFAVTGTEDILGFNPSSLAKIPVKKRATEDFINQFMANNPKGEEPQFMLDETKKGPKTKIAQIKMRVNIGAGTPKNKAFVYTAMKESLAIQAISLETYQKYLANSLGLPIPIDSQATPGATETPPPGDIQSQSENISGINVSAKNLQGRRTDIPATTTQPDATRAPGV